MSDQAKPEVAITVNSPGEVSTWLAPVVRELRKLDDQIRTSVLILPCTYAAGTEAQVVRAIPGVDAVVPPKASLRLALLGRAPRDWRPLRRGALLFLGGEFYLAARLIRRFDAAGLAYSAGYINSAAAFERVFAPRPSSKDALLRRGVRADAIEVVGDLMVDAALSEAPFRDRSGARGRLRVDDREALVALFPGSRPFEFRYALGFFARSAALLARAVERAGGIAGRALRFAVAVAPYIHEGVVREALAAAAREPGARADLDVERLFKEGDGSVEGRFTFHGQSVSIGFYRERQRTIIAAADLALAVPGSNNAEMAAWGLPMVVCLPLDKPEEIPIDGVFGLVDRIPLVGRKLKARAVLSLAERTKYVSLPNRIADDSIVPELRSRSLGPEQVADEAFRLLVDDERRKEMSVRLADAMGPPGAARRVARGVLEAAYRSAGA